MALVDLTQTYRDGMFAQRLFPPVRVTRCVKIEERRVNVTCLDVCVHHGTHIDAPRHFVADGRTVADLQLEEVSGRAVALAVQRAGGEAITVDDLEDQPRSVEAGDMVFIHSGWGPHFHADPERYGVHPYLSDDAAAWLKARRVKMLAVDFPSPDMPEPVRPEGFNWPVHHALLEAGILIAEHVANLDRVAGHRFRAFAFPLPIEGADGSPVRMVAEVDEEEMEL
jgi:kynurenine formamidase